MMGSSSVSGRTGRDGVCVSTRRAVTSLVEVIVRREAVVRRRGASSVVRNVGRASRVVA